MSRFRILTALALLTALAAPSALAQQPKTQRLRGTIERVDGNVLFIKGRDGTPITLRIPDNVDVTAAYKATLADIKEGAYIGSGAMPQPDGSQKALEVHIFAESMRGRGDGHRPWDGAPNSTMTNGAVGQAVTGVEGPMLTVKYKDGEKKIMVPPTTPIVRYDVGNKSDIKVGAAIGVVAAAKQPDGTFAAARITVGRDGGVPN